LETVPAGIQGADESGELVLGELDEREEPVRDTDD
jgi:hypothetical protein